MTNWIPVEFVVPRVSEGETTVAVVKAEVRDQSLNQPPRFRDALMRGITKWIITEKCGGSAWENSSHDFNVGDLSFHITDHILRECLLDEGIRLMDIVTHVRLEKRMSWVYDTVLAYQGDIEEAKEMVE